MESASIEKQDNIGISVSLFASSKRPMLYKSLLKSLCGTSVITEIVFSGPCSYEDINRAYSDSITECPDIQSVLPRGRFHYIQTENIKPAQCYEIARRYCYGEVVIWIADDCEFPNDVVGKAYRYWKQKNNEKLILSIQTKESGYNLPKGAFFDMNMHRFFGYDIKSPLMAPLGLMSRNFLNELGGIDRRYVCGQYENDIVMRAYQNGGVVEIFGGEDCYIDIDHMGKSIACGESITSKDFLKRPFATGYHKDREILENSWTLSGPSVVLKKRRDEFLPFKDMDIMKVSQSNKGIWE